MKAILYLKVGVHNWVEFLEYTMDHCIATGLSVIAVDVDNSRIAGVLLVKDFNYVIKKNPRNAHAHFRRAFS